MALTAFDRIGMDRRIYHNDDILRCIVKRVGIVVYNKVTTLN